MVRFALLAVLLFGAAPARADIPAPERKWEALYEEDGIEVWKRSVEGSSFVEFRGRGVIETSMKKLLAVLNDQKRKTEWMYSCADNRLLAAKGLGKLVIYNRTASTVPLVADRDVVVETTLDWSVADKRVHIEARAIEDKRMPPVDGVVRMPKLDLVWDLKAIGKERTEVTYIVAADPGGLLPAWLVNMVSKKIPYHTIANLRRQTQQDYSDALAVVEASFDWSAVEGGN